MNFFSFKEGGKTRIHLGRCACVSLGGIGFFMTAGLYSTSNDTSFVSKTSEPIVKKEEAAKGQEAGALQAPSYVKIASKQGVENRGSASDNYQLPSRAFLKYQAKQILERPDIQDVENSLPVGSNMVGRLLTSLDTRDPAQIIKVLLPYGGTFRNQRIIEQNSVLIGKASYPGNGEKVFINFELGVFPDGREFKIQAQALNSKDYSSGLDGDFYSQADMRFLATLGMNILSVGTETLTEKEALTPGQAPTAKATMRNAVLQGASKGTQMEGERLVEEIGNRKEYVTVDAGIDLIVNLTASLRGNVLD